MKKTRKLLGLLLALALIIALLPTIALADELTEISEVEVLDLAFPKYGETPDYDVALPLGAPYHLASIDEMLAYGAITVEGIKNGIRWIAYDTETQTIRYLAFDETYDTTAEYYAVIHLIPNEGYKFAENVTGMCSGMRFMIISGDEELANAYTYQFSVYVPENPFEDVAEEAWYYEAVEWAVEEEITDGMDETHFCPDYNCTRAQVVTFLWRNAGQPAPTTADNPFEDVAEDTWYYDAVLWAVENGITDGMDETHFCPDDYCTRAQIVTFLWRYAGQPAPIAADNPFEDVAEDTWYYDAVLWAVENGITDGMDEAHFCPDDYCTRAQVVTFLYRSR